MAALRARAKSGRGHLELQHGFSVQESGTAALRPASQGGIGQKRIDLAFIGTVLRPDHGRAEVRRDFVEFQATQNGHVEPELRLPARLLDQKIELALIFRDHQSAGYPELAIRAELLLE